jgi:tmRNA-binding protein
MNVFIAVHNAAVILHNIAVTKYNRPFYKQQFESAKRKLLDNKIVKALRKEHKNDPRVLVVYVHDDGSYHSSP